MSAYLIFTRGQTLDAEELVIYWKHRSRDRSFSPNSMDGEH
jgi:hypothetical protein